VPCADGGCGCIGISQCTSKGCVRLADLIRDFPKPRHDGCRLNAECNWPHGTCEASTCRCRVDVNASLSFGGVNCSIDNSNRAARRADMQYGEHVFQKEYTADTIALRAKLLQSDDAPESGHGSTRKATLGMRTALPHLLKLLDVRSIIDLPSGDFRYMRELVPTFRELGVQYTGLDIVASLSKALQATFGQHSPATVKFMQFDVATQMLWPADLIICRDLLLHFDPSRAARVLQRIRRSGSKWLLASHHPGLSEEASGALRFTAGNAFGSHWSPNLEGRPLNMPPPLLAIGLDGTWWSRETGGFATASTTQRVMGLWRLN
jgi:hypothetical protein